MKKLIFRIFPNINIMKKTIQITAIISAFLIGCNEGKNEQNITETIESIETVQENSTSNSLSSDEKITADPHSINNTWIKDIKLDDGQKWQANTETTEGVEKMLNLVKTSDLKTVEGYHNLASKLNEDKNFVVKKCTMKSLSHDNLHVFLHPLIEKIEALGKVESSEEGAVVTASIKENLEYYYPYFQ